MVCSAFTGITNVADLLVWPAGCFYHFYTVVLVVIFITSSLILYNTEKEDQIRSDLVSCMGVSAIVTVVMALIGTLIENSSGIPMVQSDILLYIFAFAIIFIVIWFFKK